jgi:hypothetical protein
MWLYCKAAGLNLVCTVALNASKAFPYKKKVEKFHAGYKNQMEFFNKHGVVWYPTWRHSSSKGQSF